MDDKTHTGDSKNRTRKAKQLLINKCYIRSLYKQNKKNGENNIN